MEGCSLWRQKRNKLNKKGTSIKGIETQQRRSGCERDANESECKESAKSAESARPILIATQRLEIF